MKYIIGRIIEESATHYITQYGSTIIKWSKAHYQKYEEVS